MSISTGLIWLRKEVVRQQPVNDHDTRYIYTIMRFKGLKQSLGLKCET